MPAKTKAPKAKSSFEIVKDKLSDNLNFLRKGLESYTVEDTEEDLEFLDAVESDVDNICEVVDEKVEEIKSLETRFEELQADYDEKIDLGGSIRTTDYIYWSAENCADQQVMETLTEAYTRLTPGEIIQRLNS